ncbi:polyprenyl synthetase family protein [Falsiphaeobacter marinintestinus]|uniref:polyprenyl synthetase family protein n=1 Tax=Falsiphaeobacter marinintestinus TaxID=1492905 RepID=UPI0011B779A6|nr:farnesyl diphosphate synthase [Phaeobacter marinintestinus]
MFAQRLTEDGGLIVTHFDTVFNRLDDLPVTRAMAYATTGGKRLRGFLVLESARLHDVAPATAIWPACAIEALHAYSLVHDDLPCMDDDDLRRGRPTVHVAFDETTAVLAGDALQTLAFELAAHPDCGPAQVRADLALSLAQASGAQGMVLGQALDIAAESTDTPLTLEQITHLQAGKTGALITWSACAGAVLAQAEPEPLRQYAQALGLAFQIADDILDEEGDAEKAGKRLRKDADAGKATFVSLLGLEAAKSRAADLVDQACTAVDVYGDRAETLRDAARFVISRES